MSITVTTNTVTEIDATIAVCGGALSGTYSGNYQPIVDHIMDNKFKLYHRTRQKIVSNVKATAPIQPFSLYEDDKQDESGSFKQFVLSAYVWHPISEVLEVELVEYDNTSEITHNEIP